MNAAGEIAWLLLPVACFLTALWMTRRLQCDDPFDKARAKGLWLPLMLVSVLAFGLFFMALFARSERMILAGVCTLILSMGWAAHRLSTRRAASREMLFAALPNVALFVWMAFWGDHARWRPPVAPAIGLQWFAGAAAAGMVILGALRWRNGPTAHARGGVLISLFVLAPLAALPVWAAWRTEHRTPSQLVDYAEAFDDPVDELTRWDEFGDVVHWLVRAGHEPDVSRARTTIRKAIAAGKDVLPSTVLGAWRAGLLGPEAFAQLHAAWAPRLRQMDLEGNGPFIWTLSQPVNLLALFEAGGLDDAQRAHLVKRITASWPMEPGIGNLKEARQIAGLLAWVGAEDRIPAHSAALRSMLVRSWCEDAPWFAYPGGFSAYDEGGLHAPDDRANLDALDLMAAVGVPEEVDLLLFEAHLHHETIRSPVSLSPAIGRFDVLNHLAWHRLHAEHDIPRTAAATARSWQLPAALALLLLLIVILMVRAPSVATTEE